MGHFSFDCIFKPNSVAIVGASDREGSVGGAICRNMLEAGFAGDLWFVNPHHAPLFDRPCYPGSAALPGVPDLVVIATPTPAVPGILAAFGQRGTRASVIISAGFEAEDDGLRKRSLAEAGRYGMRILGPNCLGVLVPSSGLNASFAHLPAQDGRLAFISQSGAILTSVLDWATARDIGFSAMVSLGNALDIDLAALLDHFATDHRTSAILVYMESARDAAAFMSAARHAARIKPVIVMKVGRHPEGARAALSHTGALAGSDAVYEAAFRRAGLVRVASLEELFDAAQFLSLQRPFEGKRLAIVTNGGGAGVIAVDYLHDVAGCLAVLGPQTKRALDAVLPTTWSRANPVDIIGDADGARYAAALKIVLADSGIDAVLVLCCPTSTQSSVESARAVIDTIEQGKHTAGSQKPLLTCWLGEETAQAARDLFEAASIATFESPEDAVRAVTHLMTFADARETMMRVPQATGEDFPVDRAAAQRLVQRGLEDGRRLLNEDEAKALAEAYGIPVVETRVTCTPAEAAREVGRLLGARASPAACVLKVVSPDITHKSDVGGVRLGIRSAAEAMAASEELLRVVAAKKPGARIEGIAVQPMIERKDAEQLIVGIARDATFGPVILFGAGGTAVEVLDDKAVELPPLDDLIARSMIARTRVSKLLAGYRHRPAAQIEAIVGTLIRLARLASDIPEIAELDINPLLADADGVIALDARVVIAKRETVRDPLAIAPYPSGWQREVTDTSGRPFRLRPILPTDEKLYPAFFEKTTPRDIRMRLFAARRNFSHEDFALWTQIDYRREMAFVAVDVADGTLLGVSRLAQEGNTDSAEFAVLVRSDRQGRGIGFALMRQLLAYARSRGLARLQGRVLTENACMRAFCRALGFSERRLAEEGDAIMAELDLHEPANPGIEEGNGAGRTIPAVFPSRHPPDLA